APLSNASCSNIQLPMLLKALIKSILIYWFYTIRS
ncbi:MAG: hypothetical protein ACI9XU_002058, partial [Arenicella sp.]